MNVNNHADGTSCSPDVQAFNVGRPGRWRCQCGQLWEHDEMGWVSSSNLPRYWADPTSRLVRILDRLRGIHRSTHAPIERAR